MPKNFEQEKIKEIREFEIKFSHALDGGWYEKTPLEKERWFNTFKDYFSRQARLNALEEVEKAFPVIKIPIDKGMEALAQPIFSLSQVKETLKKLKN